MFLSTLKYPFCISPLMLSGLMKAQHVPKYPLVPVLHQSSPFTVPLMRAQHVPKYPLVPDLHQPFNVIKKSPLMLLPG